MASCPRWTPTADAGEGKVRYEWRRVLPVDLLRTLPQVRHGDGRLVMFGLLIHRSTPVTITRVRPVWERREVRAAGAPGPLARIEDVLGPLDPTSPSSSTKAPTVLTLDEQVTTLRRTVAPPSRETITTTKITKDPG